MTRTAMDEVIALVLLLGVAFLAVAALALALAAIRPTTPAPPPPPAPTVYRCVISEEAIRSAYVVGSQVVSAFGIAATDAMEAQVQLTRHAEARALEDAGHFTAWVVLRLCRPLEIAMCPQDPRGPTVYVTCREAGGIMCATGVFVIRGAELVGVTAYVRPCEKLDRMLKDCIPSPGLQISFP